MQVVHFFSLSKGSVPMNMRFVMPLMFSACFSISAMAAEAPSSEAKQAAKVAKESAGSFDPQVYTCGAFMKDLEQGSDMAGIALIWTHGYQSAIYGTDEMGALNEETIATIAQEIAEHCAEASDETFSRMSRAITAEEQ